MLILESVAEVAGEALLKHTLSKEFIRSKVRDSGQNTIAQSLLYGPFLAGAKLAAMKASRTAIAPIATSSLARAVMIFVITAGCGQIPANTPTIEREPAASFKPPPDQCQN